MFAQRLHYFSPCSQSGIYTYPLRLYIFSIQLVLVLWSPKCLHYFSLCDWYTSLLVWHLHLTNQLRVYIFQYILYSQLVWVLSLPSVYTIFHHVLGIQVCEPGLYNSPLRVYIFQYIVSQFGFYLPSVYKLATKPSISQPLPLLYYFCNYYMLLLFDTNIWLMWCLLPKQLFSSQPLPYRPL